MSGTQISVQGNVTAAQFKADFTAFADPAKYPESDCNLYLTLANAVLDPRRFGQYLNMAIELFTAHYLTLDAIDNAAAAKGGIPGQQGGQIASKSVGGASINYDTAASVEPGGGHWNLTTFGKRYYRLVMMAGMGGVQVTGAQLPNGTPFPGTDA
jgi:hypothetical protein